MPDVRAFKGVLYNSEKIKDIAKVVTEPYDVISSSEQAQYYRAHPCNIVRLILGKNYSGDTNKKNSYTRAAKFFNKWLKQDILLRDKKENIYIYTQTFSRNGKRKTRTGFIVLLKLEDFAKNTILPHENTFSQPVQDRLKLMKTVGANLSPIFTIFVDPQKKTNKLLSQFKEAHQPCVAIEKDKVVHRLWRMSDKKKLATIKKLVKQQQIFIADGHHRYEAALNYKIQTQAGKKGRKRRSFSDYAMTYLVPTADRGLTILPTHRALKVKTRFKAEEIIRDLKKCFEVRKFSTSDELFSYMRKHRGSGIFGVYFGKNRFCGLRLKNTKVSSDFIGKNSLIPRKELDVTILHSVIIGHFLNAASSFKENIFYTRDAQECIKLVDEDKYQVAFFLRATTVAQVRRTASAGERMPHKSTYFYPKLLTGLVINKLNDK